MKKLIGKRGLKIEDQEAEIEAVLAEVNGRRSRWTAEYGDIADMAGKAERQLMTASLPASYRVGATAECFTDAPWANSYRNAVRGNRILLRRFAEGWRVVGIEQEDLYPKDSRANQVKISLSADQIERVKAAAVAPFAVQPEREPTNPFDGADCYDAAGRLQKAA